MSNVYFIQLCPECRRRTLFKWVPRRGIKKTTWKCSKCGATITYSLDEYHTLLKKEYAARGEEDDIDLCW